MAVYSLQPRTVDESGRRTSSETPSFDIPFDPKNPDPFLFQSWVDESRTASREWRAESWRDCEMFDGNQWTDEMLQKAIDAGVDPLTINQIFPTLSLVIGSQTLNKLDIIAKGRTHKDSEISQIMTEGLKYVMDHNNGEFKVSSAFKSQLIAGFGCLAVTYDTDPRNEIIKVSDRDWKEMGWDNYSSPWFDPTECRYVYHQKWIDLGDLISLFPDKKQEIENAFQQSVNTPTNSSGNSDEADEVEWKRRQFGSSTGWIDASRKRCRPVEMWYTVSEPAYFVRYPDGSVDELSETIPIQQQFAMVQSSTEVVSAIVKHMRYCIFLGPLVLIEGPTPYAHDEFPFIPFVGYENRYHWPYGVPRQVRDMQVETNKRRSMALRLLNSHQTIAESDVTDEGNLQHLYEEANKPDGFLVVRPGALGKIQIVDKSPMAPGQMNMMQQSELEIQRVSGINADLMGQKTGGSESGRAIEKRTNQGVTITAPLFDNLRRSMKKLGELVVAGMQDRWTGEKVLRITDRISGAERFVELNKRVWNQNGAYEVKNDISAGRYDIVISEVPIADTIRERNMELLIETAKRSTPEMLGPVIMAAMELSNIPNKDKLLAQLKPIMGISPEMDDMDADQLRQFQIDQAKGKAEADGAMQQIQIQMAQAGLQKAMAEVEKVRADTARVMGNVDLDPIRVQQISTKIAAEHAKAQNDSARIEIEGFAKGAEVQHKNERIMMEKENRREDDLHHIIDKQIDSAHQVADRQQLDVHKAADIQKEMESARGQGTEGQDTGTQQVLTPDNMPLDQSNM